MIARIWHGRVPVAKSDAYLEHMRTVAIPRYREVPGTHMSSVTKLELGDEIARFLKG